ncbi:MAG: DUF87 domain-containing protein, partial [Nanoarchaeota archaeon]|nr:DUF87 domain-containing protein [Nanoarchaeota archaeon]
MTYNIIVGRNEDDRKKFGDQGTIFLGKHYIKMGQFTSLSNPVYLDVNTSHIVLVSGKRGGGKSYSISSIAEEMTRLPEEVANNLAILMFDTMGIFWTMKYPNTAQEKQLQAWNLKPEGMQVTIYVPEGKFKDYQQKGIPVDKPFSIKTAELTAQDWCNVFTINQNDDKGVLISRILKELPTDYSIQDIINHIKKDARATTPIKDAVEGLFETATTWGLFSATGNN